MFNNETIVARITTAHDVYQVVDRVYEGRDARVLFSGSRRAAQSGIARDDNPDLLFDYNQRLLELANAIYPSNILVIGGGAFTLPMALVAGLPDATVDVVELDEGLEAIAREYFGLQNNSRMRITAADGRSFLQSSKKRYDMIILDVFSELSIPRQFLTIEFMQLAQKHLSKGGCVAMNIIASTTGRTNGLLKSQVAGYNQVFERLDIYPADHGLSGWLPQNLVLLAQHESSEDYRHYVRFAALQPPEASAEDIYYD